MTNFSDLLTPFQKIGDAIGNIGEELQSVSLESIAKSIGLNLIATDFFSDQQSYLGENPLNGFVTYDYVITLSVLTAKSINDPNGTYMSGNPAVGDVVILRSCGVKPNEGIDLGIGLGVVDCYITDLEIDSIAAKAHNFTSNGITFEMKVLEPYSIGLFLEALLIAAGKSGSGFDIKSRAIQTVPYLLKIEFVGYDADGKAGQIPGTTRYLPIQITDVAISFANGGTKYDIKAIPWNFQTLDQIHNVLFHDVTISGATVQEILQTGKNSFVKHVNDGYAQAAKNISPKIIPDEIAIIFPKNIDSSGKTTNLSEAGAFYKVASNIRSSVSGLFSSESFGQSTEVNEIGLSKLRIDSSSFGDQSDLGAKDVQPDASKPIRRDLIKVYTDRRDFKFTQKSTIVNAINQVVLQSEFISNAYFSNDKSGFINTFRIKPLVFEKTENADENIKVLGRPPRLFVFEVYPFKILKSSIIPGGTQSENPNIMKNLVCRKYDYLYTGKNLDILKLDIDLKLAYFRTLNSDNTQRNRDTVMSTQQGSVVNKNSEPFGLNTVGTSNADKITGTVVTERNPNMLTEGYGGGGSNDYLTVATKQLHDLILDAGVNERFTIEMDILGDPYYLSSSGIGNFSESTSKAFNITSEGSANYESGEVDIWINYRAPLDINPYTGVYKFHKITDGFSGYYRLVKIIHKFNHGKFTQTISGFRRPGQDVLWNSTERPAITDAAANNTNAASQQEPTQTPNAAATGNNQTSNGSPIVANPTENKGRAVEPAPTPAKSVAAPPKIISI